MKTILSKISLYKNSIKRKWNLQNTTLNCFHYLTISISLDQNNINRKLMLVL